MMIDLPEKGCCEQSFVVDPDVPFEVELSKLILDELYDERDDVGASSFLAVNISYSLHIKKRAGDLTQRTTCALSTSLRTP
jgi:hypothetical protein